jgi:hypothetical protein
MGSLEGGIKTIIGTNHDLVFLYKHCTVFSGKLAMDKYALVSFSKT